MYHRKKKDTKQTIKSWTEPYIYYSSVILN